MLDPSNIPPVDGEELVSRFVLSKRYFNSQTGTLKADAFIPHPYDELSVTRHLQATEDELWDVGTSVAKAIDKTLHGRGDVVANTYLTQNLKVIADPVEGNPNHVNICGWPMNDKPAQKLIAKEIAAVAKFVKTPLQ